MKRSVCAVAVTALFAVIGTTGPAVAASGDEPIEEPGVGWKLGPGQTSLADDPRAIAEQPANDVLVRLYKLYDAIEEPGLSDSQFDSIADKITTLQATYEKLSGERIENVAPSPQVMRMSRATRASSADVTTAAAVPSSHFLPVKHSTQSTAYYCGPASTLMALRAMGASERSQLNHSHTLSQKTLASSTYLATTESGGTYIYRMPTTMKNWAGVSSQVYRGLDRAGLKSTVRRSNGQFNKALIYGTHEDGNPQRPHYNNHYKTFDVDHFVMGYGYSENGDRLHYADPLGGRWPNVKDKKSMTTNAMAGFTAIYGTVA